MDVRPWPEAGPSTGRLFGRLCLLWLAGLTMRLTIIAVPPVIPLIHDDLHLTEAQVGLLIGLPLIAFAIAAVPGSLLVARLGATLTLALGMVVTGLAAGARGDATNVWLLYGATLVMGFGIAVMHPALPTLVREWVPQRIVLGTAVSTQGIVTGVALGPAMTIPLVLPLVGYNWRFDFLAWSAPVLLIGLIYFALSAATDHPASPGVKIERRWWPDWKNPRVLLLGLTFGVNNSGFHAINAFLPDYLNSIGRPELTASTLGWLNGSQIVASLLLLAIAERLHGRAWPFLVFGPATLIGVIVIVMIGEGWNPLLAVDWNALTGADVTAALATVNWSMLAGGGRLALTSGDWIVIAATVVGFATAITFVVILALPPYLSAPGDVHRTSAGMFTISFSLAVVIPTISGSLWDMTGIPWTAFVPACLCALALTVFGAMLSRYRPRPRPILRPQIGGRPPPGASRARITQDDKRLRG
jgi:MFS transporter, CP family, cyanate transporter